MVTKKHVVSFTRLEKSENRAAILSIRILQLIMCSVKKKMLVAVAVGACIEEFHL